MPNCRSCGAEIIWAVTELGKRMPLDAEPAERPTGLFRIQREEDGAVRAFSVSGQPVYLSHFATCPHADQHRKEPDGNR